MLIKNAKGALKRRYNHYLSKDDKLRKIAKRVKNDFDSSSLTAHNWEHIYRDTLNAIVIGESEKTDMSIVLPSIIMHDIGFLYGGTGKTHGAIGAQKLQTYLKKIKVSFPTKVVHHIANCIRTHKGSMHNEKPKTLEAKVVADADLLEKFGPLGVYQYIRTFTEFNKGIEEIISRKDTMSKLTLETKTGRKIAEEGRKYFIKYLIELDNSYKAYR